MITIEMLCARIEGLQPAELDRWIENQWVRPAGEPGHWLFQEIDVARVRLIRELRQELGLDEDAVPVTLSLLDQLYDARRRTRRLCAIIDRLAPDDLRQRIISAWREEGTE
jgi:chaperone modulatory protein CbpM